MHVPRAFAQQLQLDEAIASIRPALSSDVVQLTYELGHDWTGDPAIFFRIVLSDRASRREELHRATEQMENAIMMGLEPLEQWGVLPYFSYRSQAEQAVLQETPWV